MSELIQDKKNGYLVSNIKEAVNAIKEIQSIDRNYCRKTIEKAFTAEHMTNNYIDAYNIVLEKNKHS